VIHHLAVGTPFINEEEKYGKDQARARDDEKMWETALEECRYSEPVWAYRYPDDNTLRRYIFG